MPHTLSASSVPFVRGTLPFWPFMYVLSHPVFTATFTSEGDELGRT
ncbi:hypothetical protein [Halorussus aquaticus]|uniref:Uncharacterized protein n=1 Tax=Halorussus aquaticus TaxID=2953748 RepID=A0ABD5Q3S7_9EURY|nr:hypothetical protein [Halorussus aquaticus]